MIRLRPYQEQALQVFQENGNRGIFDMATGTGKTFTSIACANAFYEDNKRQFLV
ncbi:DEAD/DEAH box helicase family protein, partial [Salmonella enterica subsp. enterica serovar Enteritidis]|nr:DEAD/DEAH box helicase family protein [Salmonella enterica subsp. enterica serovar Enteritidis]